MIQIKFVGLFCLLIVLSCNQKTQPVLTISPPSHVKDTTQTITKKLKIIDSLILKNYQTSQLYESKARLFLQTKNIDSAIAYYQKTIAIDKKNDNAKITLAYIYAEAKNPLSLGLCQQVINQKKTPLLAKAYYIKGVYFTSINNFLKAIESYTLCIKNDWTFIDAYLERGIIMLKINQNQNALKNFLLAVKVNNKNGESYYWLGRAYEQTNDLKKAQLAYKHCLLLDPTFEAARQKLYQKK